MQETWVQSLGWEDPLEKEKSYPLQYSGLGNSMDCIVHGIAKSQTWLSDFHKRTRVTKCIYFIKKKKTQLFELNTSLLLLLKITYMAKTRYNLLFSVNFSNSWVQLRAHFLAHIKTENIATEKTQEFSIQAAVATQCLCRNVFFLAVCPTAPHKRDDFILLQSHNCPGQRHEK